MSQGSVDRLVTMANQIARNFAVHGEAKATTMTTEHIRDFWDPRMKSQIKDHLKNGAKDLEPTAKAAIEKL